ncbi:MAG: STAS domain-containing protein [Acidimicrobiia bacterium]|nr:STAS domain-containing protein [Acidimicrobiia bacterium]
MSTAYELRLDTAGGVLVAALGGEVDLSNVDEIEDRIAREVGPETTGLAIDLRELTYLDSSGVRLLLNLNDRLRGVRRGFAVARARDGVVARVVELVHLGDEMTLTDDIEGAVEAAGGSG